MTKNGKIAFSIWLIWIVAVSHGYGQLSNVISINGLVTDLQNKPISGTLCLLKQNGQIGAVTDSMGYFSINCPGIFMKDTLEVSFVGYKKELIPVSGIGDDTLSIKLEKSAVMLKNVNINAHSDSLRRLFLTTYEKIEKHSPKKIHQLNGFYRRVTYENDTAVSMAEVAFVLQDPGIQKPASDIRVKIIGYRQSRYWGVDDSLYLLEDRIMHLKQHKRMHVAYPNSLGHGFRFLRLTAKTVLHPYYLRPDEFDFDLITTLPHFKIGITKPGGSLFYEGNYIVIDQTNYTIGELELTTLVVNKSRKFPVMLKYSVIDGKQYPYFLKLIQPTRPYNPPKPNSYSVVEVWFEKVITKGIKKIRGGKSPRHNMDYLEKMKYEPAFWNSYESINNHPLPLDIKTSLEANQSLEEQFRSPKQLEMVHSLFE